MPLLNAQYGGMGRTKDGKTIPLPPQMALWQRGPCAQVAIGLSDQVAQELIKRNEPVPAPTVGLALIDTGSSSSCIDEETAKGMGLPVVGVANLASASHSSHAANQYPIKIDLQGVKFAFNVPNAIGAPLKCQNLIAIIGRDVLQRCCLIYNGATGSITLSI
jgi:predicted aspartyl protease